MFCHRYFHSHTVKTHDLLLIIWQRNLRQLKCIANMGIPHSFMTTFTSDSCQFNSITISRDLWMKFILISISGNYGKLVSQRTPDVLIVSLSHQRRCSVNLISLLWHVLAVTSWHIKICFSESQSKNLNESKFIYGSSIIFLSGCYRRT